METRVKLSNGLTVVNFSSPHSFVFSTGEVLPGCDAERSKALMLESVENGEDSPCGRYENISLIFVMTTEVKAELDRLNADPTVDVIIVPLPVMTALKNAGLAIGKVRVCRSADRISKAIFPDKFCI